MSYNINLLISLLKCIESDNSIIIKDNIYSESHPLVIAVKYLANKYLINKDGHPDNDNIDIVIADGFSIFPGEKDRFGWIIGCIQLTDGIITFG
jgi:hypothetical protein